jgi:hypothetical protein
VKLQRIRLVVLPIRVPPKSFTGGKTVREWLTGKSYDEQYSFGRDILDRIQSGRLYRCEIRDLDMMSESEIKVRGSAADLSSESLGQISLHPVGIRNLAFLLRFNGTVMSGGLTFAAEVADDGLLEEVETACDYFSLPEVKDVVARIKAANKDYDLIDEWEDEYYEVSGESAGGTPVFEREFKRKLAESPEDFLLPDSDLEAKHRLRGG